MGADKLQVEAERLLVLWDSAYGVLSSDGRESFLKRPEVEEVRRLPGAAVLAALSRSPKLARIVEIADREAWWYEDRPCEDDALPWCARCKPHPYPSVVVMTRGAATRSTSLKTASGSSKARRQSWQEEAKLPSVERVKIQVAFGVGKLACRWCFPCKEGTTYPQQWVALVSTGAPRVQLRRRPG